jgi:hypothetical protein
MSSTPQSAWHALARLEFPDTKIIGDGPFLVAPCFPKAIVRLYGTLAEAKHARDRIQCCPFCAGTHRGMILRQPAPQQIVHRQISDIERD